MMKPISAWFNRHVKTRITLQLILEGLPAFLCTFPFVIGIVEVNFQGIKLPYLLDAIAILSMQCVMYGGAAMLYIFDLWLSSRTKRVFEQYPLCRSVSVILRVLSIVPAVLSLGLFIGLMFYAFKN